MQPEFAGRITAELTQYYLTEGPMDEGALLAEQVLKHSADMSPGRAWLEFVAGTLAFHQAKTDTARR